MLPVTRLLEVALGDGPQAAPQAPRSPVVVWNVCRHCNMTCPHCYLAAVARPAAGDLDTAEALALLERLAVGGVRVLVFSGGEPLLRPDLLRLARRAGELGIVAHLSTNGVLVTDRVATRLAAAGLRYVGISLDGLEPHNDRYRGLAGGFRRAVRGLQHARRAGMRTGLRVTLTAHNADQLAALYEVAEEAAADRFYLSHLVPSGRARTMTAANLPPSRTRELLHGLFELAQSRLGCVPAIVTGANDSDGVLLLQWVRRRYGDEAATRIEQALRARGGNTAGEGVLCVDSRGRVHPDPFWRSVTLGDLRREPLAAVLEHPLLAALRARDQRLEGRCRDCRYLPLCRGAHRGRAEALAGSRWASDPACVMHDEEIRR